MVQQQSIVSVPVVWRGKKYVLNVNSEASVWELGEELRKLTDIKSDTMRLIVPQSSVKSSRLLMPFSDDHSSIKLQDAGITDGKPLRMMGVLANEVDQLLKDSQAKLRIPGFEEEERRMKERLSKGPRKSLKLPEGPYVFGDFRALEIPGTELNPPPSEALKRMHILAADLGIVAIMNKHRWRVGIMTEMAPVGYVGISPMCLLGLNKNHGEEISLRLRTDDLKGFRKYERIKKTLLHELAHMVYSEHDENFHALDKQLNQEAFALDWTQSRSHTLANTQFQGDDDDFDMDFELESGLPQKLGGETSAKPASARVAAATAAYHRFSHSAAIPSGPLAYKENSDYSEVPVDKMSEKRVTRTMEEPDPDDTEANSDYSEVLVDKMSEERVTRTRTMEEPDPDDTEANSDYSEVLWDKMSEKRVTRTMEEPDPDDTMEVRSAVNNVVSGAVNDDAGDHSQLSNVDVEYDSPEGYTIGQATDALTMGVMSYEPDPDDEELRRVQDPVTEFCNRLTKAIEMLQHELNPSEVAVVQQTLFKIIRNISENPNEMKYKKIRKANPVFQRSIANAKAALDILFLVGFVEEVVTDEFGKAETYLVMKRNDPGLLWLAKSCLETVSGLS
ncbi:hypothetical protein RND81_09G190000 [Saponaria officinalis]|uniref:WLM domain-containing protein n=1 Tax=Saponaria officinalis TaxID=3572 RepID=A0AAW1IMU1_SAPOF